VAQYDDPEIPDDDDYEVIKAQAVELGDGLITLYLPKDWPLTEQGFLNATLDVSWVESGQLYLRGWSYEATEDIRNNDLAHFVAGPDLPEIDEENVPKDETGARNFAAVTHRASGTAERPEAPAGEPREAFRLWRRIGLLRPDHVRVFEAHLYVPGESADSEGADRARHYLEHLIPRAVFADRPMTADRIAPSPTLRKDSFWDSIYLRVPHDWPDAERSERSDGAHRYVYDDTDPRARWTLWVDLERFLGPDAGLTGIDAARYAQRIADKSPSAGKPGHTIWVDPMPDRPDEAAVKILYDGIEDGERLRFLNWYKIVRVGRGLLMGAFNWVVVSWFAEEPEIAALTELIETEVLNAVLRDPEADRLAPAAGGRA